MEQWLKLFDDWKISGIQLDPMFLRPQSVCPVGSWPLRVAEEGRTYRQNAVSRLQDAWKDGGKWRPKPAGELRSEPTWVIGLMVEPLEPFVRKHLGLEIDVGMRVVYVSASRPVAHSGIRVDDIIYKAGGTSLTSMADLLLAVDRAGRSGRPLKLQWLHDGERRDAELLPVRRVDPPMPPRTIQPVPAAKEPEDPTLEFNRRQEKLDELLRELENQKFEMKR